jgi:general secretion pathway protein E
MKVDKKELDLRISTVPCIYGEIVCIRILQRETLCLDISRANFNPTQMETVKRWYSRPNGVVLVTGPTGSGKTTVLYMILNELNKEKVKVVSIEDPVEYTFEGVNQIPVNPKLGLTFHRAMRAVLRQDPDVVMIGEIRDLETSQIMIQAALTGHLVLSSLHTNTATDGIIRLRDMGVEPFLIKDCLVGIMSQRLVRVLCKDCRKAYVPDDITMQYLGLDKKQKFYKAVGCSKCNNIGFRGRNAIFEMFEPSNASMSMLFNGCTAEEFRRQALSEGMVSMFKHGIEKAAAGVTTLEEVVRATGGMSSAC